MNIKHQLEARSLSVMGVKKPRQTILHEVSLSVQSGQVLAIIGPNGAGKSTLIRALTGLIQIDTGEILLDGQNLQTHSRKFRAQAMAWLPQIQAVNEKINVVDYLSGSRFRFSETRHHSNKAIRQSLHDCGIAHLSDRSVDSLSGGELQRMHFASCLAQESAFLILDEPVNHLDPVREAEFLVLIKKALRRNIGIIIVTHDINLLHRMNSGEQSPIVMGMKEGRHRFSLDLEGTELSEALSELYELRFLSVMMQGYTHYYPDLSHV